MQHGHRHEDLVAELDTESRPYIPSPLDEAMQPHKVPVRNVTAIFEFRGGAGRERDAAEAWAFELTYFFLRGVGEAPTVSYHPGLPPGSGVYTCTGLMSTTHPGDRAPVTRFSHGEPPDLDFILSPWRQKTLRKVRAATSPAWRFDGRDGE